MDEEVQILMVEDSTDFVDLIKTSLKKKHNGAYCLETVDNGEAALARLRNTSELPHLILLDLNLPKMSGIEVLREIKSDPELRQIPVVILTSSDSDDDVARCFDSHCNTYVRKSVGDIESVANAIWTFWIETAVLPKPYLKPPRTLPPI